MPVLRSSEIVIASRHVRLRQTVELAELAKSRGLSDRPLRADGGRSAFGDRPRKLKSSASSPLISKGLQPATRPPCRVGVCQLFLDVLGNLAVAGLRKGVPKLDRLGLFISGNVRRPPRDIHPRPYGARPPNHAGLRLKGRQESFALRSSALLGPRPGQLAQPRNPEMPRIICRDTAAEAPAVPLAQPRAPHGRYGRY